MNIYLANNSVIITIADEVLLKHDEAIKQHLALADREQYSSIAVYKGSLNWVLTFNQLLLKLSKTK